MSAGVNVFSNPSPMYLCGTLVVAEIVSALLIVSSNTIEPTGVGVGVGA